MIRDRALKVLLVLVGLALLACIYPLQGALRDLTHTDISTGDQMILGILFPFGFFMLLAARNPAANRTLILAFAWSIICHMSVMTLQALHAGHMHGDWPGLAGLTVVGIALLALAPRKAVPA